MDSRSGEGGGGAQGKGERGGPAGNREECLASRTNAQQSVLRNKALFHRPPANAT